MRGPIKRAREERETRVSARRILAAKQEQVRLSNIRESHRMKAKGYSNVAIAQELGVAESTVRGWLKEGLA